MKSSRIAFRCLFSALFAIATVIGLVVVGSTAASAADVRVGCSAAELSAALSGATDGQVFSLAPKCTYSITSTLYTDVNLTIKGNGATIKPNSATGTPVSSLLDVAYGTASISATSFRGAYDAFVGGAIQNNGTLTISRCSFADNAGLHGGAIFNFGQLQISGSTFTGNHTDTLGDGGAIENAKQLTVTASTFVGNSALTGGGAIENDGTANITLSSFVNNTSADPGDNAYGGAISNDGIMTLTGDALAGNTTHGDGGGIATGGTLTVTGTAITNNTAAAGGLSGVPGGFGGAISQDGGTLTIRNSLITGNKAVSGGAIHSMYDGTTSLSRTVIAHNKPDNCAPAGTIAGCT